VLALSPRRSTALPGPADPPLAELQDTEDVVPLHGFERAGAGGLDRGAAIPLLVWFFLGSGPPPLSAGDGVRM